MLGLPPNVPIYFATNLADTWVTASTGLRAIVERHAGQLSVLVDESSDEVKILFQDRSDIVLF